MNAFPPSSSLDIGFRAKLTFSGFDDPAHGPERLYPAYVPGGFIFQTSRTQHPWVIVDLEAAHVISSITLFNREDVGSIVIDRVVPMTVEVDVGDGWVLKETIEQKFGGRISGKPLVLAYPFGVRVRRLRFKLLNNNHFHLDYIRIDQFVPNLDFGYAHALAKSEHSVTCEYIHRNISGLYSTFSTALHDICRLARARISVRRVDLGLSFSYFKDRQFHDVFAEFFEPLKDQDLDLLSGLLFDIGSVHKVYKELPLDRLHQAATSLFSPSNVVRDKCTALLDEAKIVSYRSITIVYRGTDKSTEVTLAPISAYIEITRRILAEHPGLDIVIQTDQGQAKDEVVKAFGGSVKALDLPVSQGNLAIHLELNKITAMSKREFGISIMAATLAHSKSRFLVTHTGNLGCWMAIYRGHARDLYQFDDRGNLVAPDESGFKEARLIEVA